MNKQTKIIDKKVLKNLFIKGDKYVVWKAEHKVKNDHIAEKVYIRKER